MYIVPLLLHSVNIYLFAGGRFRPLFYVLSLGINDRGTIKREDAMENKNASKKKTGEPMSLKEKRGQAIAGSKRIAEERAERRRLMGFDV